MCGGWGRRSEGGAGFGGLFAALLRRQIVAGRVSAVLRQRRAPEGASGSGVCLTGADRKGNRCAITKSRMLTVGDDAMNEKQGRSVGGPRLGGGSAWDMLLPDKRFATFSRSGAIMKQDAPDDRLLQGGLCHRRQWL